MKKLFRHWAGRGGQAGFISGTTWGGTQQADPQFRNSPLASQGGTINNIVSKVQGTLSSVAGFIFAVRNNRPSTVEFRPPADVQTGQVNQPLIPAAGGIASGLLVVGLIVLAVVGVARLTKGR